MPFAADLLERDAAPPVAFDPLAHAKSERLVARVTPVLKSFIERACHLSGRSLSDFILRSTMAEAHKTFAEYEIVLTERERQSFLNALLHPTEPSEKALAAARRYREKSRGG